MKLMTIGTGSSGNSYALTNDEGEILMIDLGLPKAGILRGIDYKISDVVGCIVTHSHLDHAKSAKKFEETGIPVWSPYMSQKKVDVQQLGGYSIQCFDVPHDGVENRGFLIYADNQRILYLADLEYCPYNFRKQKINHMIVECNYIDGNVRPDIPNYLHKIRGHCSMDTCKGIIEANQTDSLVSVLLCHMGEGIDDYEEMVKEVQTVAENGVYVDYLRSGFEVELNEFPF